MDTLVEKGKHQAFGILKACRDLEGLAFQEKLRAEWVEVLPIVRIPYSL